MSIETIRPSDAILVSDLERIKAVDEPTTRLVEACKWSRVLYPQLHQTLREVDGMVELQWPESCNDSVADVERVLLSAANDISLDVVGEANAVAAVIAYTRNNSPLIQHSPSVANALDVFLRRVFTR